MSALFPVLAARYDVVSGANELKFREYNSGVPTSTLTATITPGSYYPADDSADGDSDGLALAIKTALEAASGGTHTFNVYYRARVQNGQATGYFTIADATDEFQLIASGTTFPMEVIGFDGSGNNPSSGSSPDLFSTLSPTHTWSADQPCVRLDRARPRRKATLNVTVGGSPHVFETSPKRARRVDPYEHIAADRARLENSAADPARTFESFWGNANDGRPVRLYRKDEFSAGLLNLLATTDIEGTWFLEDMDAPPDMETRQRSGAQVYDFTVSMREWVG